MLAACLSHVRAAGLRLPKLNLLPLGAVGYRSNHSGAQTFANVVKELRRKGKLPNASSVPEFSASPGPDGGPPGGFVDIDAALLDDADLLESEEDSLQEFAPEQNDEAQPSPEDRHQQAVAAARLARQKAFEEAAQLSEEELRQRVRRSIEELVPADAANAHSASQEESELTPAQVFYMENRERLVSRAQDYYLEKHRELQMQQEEPADVEDEWRYYHDPVVRPPKGHLWSTGLEGDDDHGHEGDWLQVVESWPKGVILRQIAHD